MNTPVGAPTQAVHDRPSRIKKALQRFGIEEIYMAEADTVEAALLVSTDIVEPRTL